MNNHVVIGFSKCGCKSLAKHLSSQFVELAYYPPDRYWSTYHNNDIPVIITRDPVDRIWSAYHYFGYYRTMSLQEFLSHGKASETGVGINNPILQSDYTRYIKPWEKYGVITYRFEDVIKLPGFPHENSNKHGIIPDRYRELIHDSLKAANIPLSGEH